MNNFALLWKFLSQRKKWWLTPIVIFFVLLGALLFWGQSSAIAPFIYTMW